MFIVICYSIHEKKIASVDSKKTYEEANKFLEEDAKNTYEEEVENGGENVQLDVSDGSALLTSSNGDFEWTWEIIEV